MGAIAVCQNMKKRNLCFYNNVGGDFSPQSERLYFE